MKIITNVGYASFNKSAYKNVNNFRGKLAELQHFEIVNHYSKLFFTEMILDFSAHLKKKGRCCSPKIYIFRHEFVNLSE